MLLFRHKGIAIMKVRKVDVILQSFLIHGVNRGSMDEKEEEEQKVHASVDSWSCVRVLLFLVS